MAVNTIAVIGAGIMGRGIAQTAAMAGVQVILIDVSDAAVEKAVQTIGVTLNRLVEKGKLTQDGRQSALALIRGTTAYDGIGTAQIVIEAATENYELKASILKRVDPLAGADTIVASNTSSVSITKLASLMSHPDRFIGVHFFNPVPVMTLIEIVRGLQTSDATHGTVLEFARLLGKSPITVKNAPGFVVNRLLLPMINEAFFVLEEGYADAEEIDQGMKLGCNHPLGPLALADMIGLDVLLSVMQILYADFGDSKYRPCPLLKEMVDAGYLGRKSGRGVYSY